MLRKFVEKQARGVARRPKASAAVRSSADPREIPPSECPWTVSTPNDERRSGWTSYRTPHSRSWWAIKRITRTATFITCRVRTIPRHIASYRLLNDSTRKGPAAGPHAPEKYVLVSLISTLTLPRPELP